MKIVCEISGGADSFLSTLYAKEKYPDADIHGILVNYGQLAGAIEMEKARKFCAKNDIRLHEIFIDNLFIEGTVNGENEAATSGIAKIYTPLRNLVILSCASSLAESIGAQVVVCGSKTLSADSNPYSFKDSTLPFYKMFEAMLSYTAYSPIKIDVILAEGRQNKMTKKEVYKELLERGYGWNSFWNCFNNGPDECGKCNNCIERDKIKLELETEECK